MILSEFQAQLLLQTLADSLDIVDGFKATQRSRVQLWTDIINQQSKENKELDE